LPIEKHRTTFNFPPQPIDTSHRRACRRSAYGTHEQSERMLKYGTLCYNVSITQSVRGRPSAADIISVIAPGEHADDKS